MTNEEEIKEIRAELAKLKGNRKDSWDKLQIISSFLIPCVIALFAWTQSNNTEAARQNSTNIQLKLDSFQNDREVAISRVNAKVGQISLVSNFFDALLSKDDSRKKLAIKAVLIALPDDGPDLVRIVSSSDEQPEIKVFAKNSLSDRCNLLIQQMYSDVPAERIKAYNDLYAGWKNNSDVVAKLIAYGNQNRSNANGIYNTLVFLSQMNKESMLPHAESVKSFMRLFDKTGPKTSKKVEEIKLKLK